MLNLTYLALIMYPLITMFVPEPVKFKWWLRTGGLPMPPEVSKESARNEWKLLLTKFALIVASTYCLARYASVALNSLGLRLQQPRVIIIAGPLAGLLLILWVYSMRKLARRLISGPADARPLFLQEATWKVLMVILVGAFAEEFWRALSLSIFERGRCPQLS